MLDFETMKNFVSTNLLDTACHGLEKREGLLQRFNQLLSDNHVDKSFISKSADYVYRNLFGDYACYEPQQDIISDEPDFCERNLTGRLAGLQEPCGGILNFHEKMASGLGIEQTTLFGLELAACTLFTGFALYKQYNRKPISETDKVAQDRAELLSAAKKVADSLTNMVGVLDKAAEQSLQKASKPKM